MAASSLARPLMVLLGAGASHRADVPMASAMTEKLISALPQFQPLLAFILGSLQQQQGIRGEIPTGRVDVEDLANIVALLAERNDLDLAPFVSAWHPHLEALDRPRVKGDAVGDFLQSLAGPMPRGTASGRGKGAGQKALFRKAVAAVVGGVAAPRASQLRALCQQMPLQVQQVASIAEDRDLSYLDPLLQLFRETGRLVIASVNYDRAIELIAEQAGIPIDVGIDSWVKHRKQPGPKGLFLLKLHGSVDWWFEGDAVTRKPSNPTQPALIFGGRNKLTAAGPFLDLLGAFRAELRRCKTLVAVGHSFRDAHINEVVRRWLGEDDPDRRLCIIDPNLRQELEAGSGELPVHRQFLLWGRIQWEEEKAEDALARVLRTT